MNFRQLNFESTEIKIKIKEKFRLHVHYGGMNIVVFNVDDGPI